MPCGRRSLLRIISEKSLEDVKKQGLKKRCPIRVTIMNTFTLETGNTTVISRQAERWLSERVECAAGTMSFLRYDRVEFLVWISAVSYSMLRTFVQLTLTTAFSESSTRWIPDIFSHCRVPSDIFTDAYESQGNLPRRLFHHSDLTL